MDRNLSVAMVLLCCASMIGTIGASENWEWGGIFEVASSVSTTYTFEFRNSGAEDPDEFRASFFITPTSGFDSEAFEVAESISASYFEAAIVNNSATAVSGLQVFLNTNEVYSISYSNQSWITSVTLKFPSDGYYGMFTGHHPSELCGVDDYNSCFRDQNGQRVPILFEEVHSDHEETEHHERSAADMWFYTLVGCGLCWLVVFSGLIFIVCGTQNYQKLSRDYLHLLNLFASGAILSTVLFLVMIEGYHFLSAIGLEETEVAGIFGSCILAGFISPTLIELMVFREEVETTDFISARVVEMVESVKREPVVSESQKIVCVENEQERQQTLVLAGEGEVGVMLCAGGSDEGEACSHDHTDLEAAVTSLDSPPLSVRPKEVKIIPVKTDRIIISVICGDFLHNFCDGIFIGVAIHSCSMSLLWTIIGVTMFHEIAQELSDFVILTSKVGMSIPRALALNAAGGFSVVLGGIFTNLFTMSDLLIGAFLVYGSGNLIYLSAAELFPLLHVAPEGKGPLSRGDKLKGLLCFCLGSFVIGLTLLRHEHCEVSEDGGGDGHDH